MAKKIVVVGDVIIDQFTYSNPLKLSAETPTVVGEFDRRETFVGGAGLVVRHLLNLGAEVTLVTTLAPMEFINLQASFIGSTDPVTPEESKRLTLSARTSSLGWKMTRKSRFFVGPYKMLQIDEINKVRHTAESRADFYDVFWRAAELTDLVIVCDNRHGVIDQDTFDQVTGFCFSKNIPVWVDSQSAFHGGLELNDMIGKLFVNEEEHKKLTGFRGDVVCKRGDHGVSESWPVKGTSARIGITESGIPVDVVDTCGAGDALLAGYAVYGDLSKANEYAACSVTLKGTRVHA